MELIDKAAVIAKIKTLRKRAYELYGCSQFDTAYNNVLDSIDALDVKYEHVSKDLEDAIVQSFIYHENHGDDFRSDKQIETAYRYGFESGVKYKELTSSIIEDIEKQNIEMKAVDLKKEIKNYLDKQPIVTRSKGIDYKLVPSPEVIAKHFFELGLKTKKGE